MQRTCQGLLAGLGQHCKLPYPEKGISTHNKIAGCMEKVKIIPLEEKLISWKTSTRILSVYKPFTLWKAAKSPTRKLRTKLLFNFQINIHSIARIMARQICMEGLKLQPKVVQRQIRIPTHLATLSMQLVVEYTLFNGPVTT